MAADSFLTVKARLARALLELTEYLGEDAGAGRVLIRHKITQSDLAAIAGVARENVSRVLSDWKRRDLVTRSSGFYCLTSARTWIELVASQAAPDHHQIALGVDHGRYALRTTSVPGRAYSATPADKGLSRCPRFFEVPPKDTSAELPSDVSLVVQTGEDRGGDPRSSKLANPLTTPMGRPAVRTLSC